MPQMAQESSTELYDRDLSTKLGTTLLQTRQDGDNGENYDNYTFPAYGHISKGGEAGIVVGVIIFLVLVALAGWFIYRQLRARKLGVPAPSLNPFSDANRIGGSRSGGAIGWIREKIGMAQRRRTAGGAYEGHSTQNAAVGLGDPAGGGRTTRSQRAFGGLDPDEAWDARVGTEANGYGYEDQELSLRGAPPAHLDEETGYGGPKYGRMAARGDVESGRSELDERYDEEMGRKGPHGRNPFDDAEESNMSLREMSPRYSVDSTGTVERKSAFREAI